MSRRVLSATAMLLLMAAAAAPAALTQSQPALSIVENNAGTIVLTVKIPMVDGELPGDGSYQFPTAGGLLLIDLQPVTLPGAGGSVDVDAYLAEASFLADGVLTQLPSLLILPDEEMLTGPIHERLLELQASIDALALELEALSTEVNGQTEWAHGEILTAMAEVAWLQAMSEEASSVAGPGAEEQIAIVNSLLAYIDVMLPLVEALVDGISGTIAAANPGVPPEVWEALDEVNASVDKAMADAGAARDELVAEAGRQATMVDEAVDAQGKINGVLVALQAAYDAIMAEDEEEPEPEPEPEEPKEPSLAERIVEERMRRANENASGAQAKVEELNALAQAEAGRHSAELQNAAQEALVSIDESLAPLHWALDWTESAKSVTDGASKVALESAERSLANAIAILEAEKAVVKKYTDQQFMPTIDAQLAGASAELDKASKDIEAAQSQVEAARAQLESDIMGGLEPAEEEEEPAPEEPEGDDVFAVCMDQPTSVVCAEYQKPGSMDGQLTLVITVPNISGFIPGLPLESGAALPTGPIPVLPSTPGAPGGGVPSGPQPTLTQVAPTPTGSPGLGLPNPTLTSGSMPAVPSGSPLSAPSSLPAASSSAAASPSPSGPAPVPKLGMSVSPAKSALREGQQDVLRVTVKNEGNAVDDIYLGTQTDAPVSIDATKEVLHLEPGQAGEFVLRLTPLAPGAGKIKLVASSGNGATTSQEVPVTIAPVAKSASNLVAAVDPMLLETVVGALSQLTIRLENKGNVAEKITIASSSSGADVEPAMMELRLEPGESAIRELDVVPTQSGKSSVWVHMQSERGADLKPIVIFEAEPSSQSQDEDPVPTPAKGKSPGLALPVIVAVLALALVMVRRRVK